MSHLDLTDLMTCERCRRGLHACRCNHTEPPNRHSRKSPYDPDFLALVGRHTVAPPERPDCEDLEQD